MAIRWKSKPKARCHN